MSIVTATVGYPRIGANRELKKALEAYWSGKISTEELLQVEKRIQHYNWQQQQDAGIERIGVGDSSLYDPVLDWSVRLGIIPPRFRALSGLERYFAMARGKEGIPALEMTKWFDTNYHYLVPEISDYSLFPPDFSDFLAKITSAKEKLGERATPIILGLLTFLRLSRMGVELERVFNELSPRYVDLLKQLKALGVSEVQIHEPALVLEDANHWRQYYEKLYDELAAVGIPIHLVTYFDDLGGAYPWVVQLPVTTISLDFTRGNNLELLCSYGFPADKQLGVGIVDARNVWTVQPQVLLATLNRIQQVTSNLRIHPSASLQFVPYDVTREKQLPKPLGQVLSFAVQKLTEVKLIARGLEEGILEELLQPWEEKWQEFRAFSPVNEKVQKRLESLTPEQLERQLPYEKRRELQPKLPPFPTTTIGSFPQTKEIRQLRLKLKRGEISQEEYQKAIDAEIANCIRLQEEIGLDVLVHGEFERTDMVEFFAQKLVGFAFTEYGWVQSYGSRCVRPPIIYGDVSRLEPMTVREFKVAQSLTKKPVKGMLTGPVTMVNWSFPRADIPRAQQAMQIALALRDEVADLEAAGACMIQIDEPALREGLPLKKSRWDEYLRWAVDAFRLASAGARPETQIHTHMCYSQFGDIIEHIERLDADVLSIENSRSNNETLLQITRAGYQKQVGNGVYDVHSPAIPSVDQIFRQLQEGISHLPPQQIWVNPDCGLKTRRWEEVIPSLKNMVAATNRLRETLGMGVG
ncbi:MAG: 5-methyltetrahydropteroyltriglutamate--homocysteine S-methyltransferase [Geminocystis sp.]|nr:5-methyltetrahydropteroyltriglutamate--homocysteine S-methyltransferase [Geminocystis sp.]HIK37067.1 5-methyltetrahydropteroyltriglutamate--homocysteine S-methyltransferase [Geminocystis sp. M7585_C2015_104]MCS7148963.1 5-methyltetrahydropteroyltriglutamate--homocysteine S-methyltransferase [Geminocystis sp.]MCX8077553.1 5-methyltetrahydropteroyltriglutamate--homocysteine S-methyltransferase [Geminocystis sp.]MDW8117190.1 5-methyltetrahydropteroyltriglutamate--homocysteine S-methyltransferas